MAAETEPRDEPPAADLPPRIVAIAYVLAAICAMLPLALLGALFAGAVLYSRGLRGHGAGVIALSLVCTAIGVVLLR
jgi:hypothetical protein